MVILPTKTVSSNSPSKRRRDVRPRPRPRPPLPLEPLTRLVLPISVIPEALLAARSAVPDGVDLDLAMLAPIVLQKLPLAHATLSLWSYLLQPSALDEIFARHRGQSFEDIVPRSEGDNALARSAVAALCAQLVSVEHPGDYVV
jgi:hypothetical protein